MFLLCLSKLNITLAGFGFLQKTKQSDPQNSITSLSPPPGQAWSTVVNFSRSAQSPASDVPLLAGSSTVQSTPCHDQSPTQTSRAHNHKSHPRKHTPTTSLHKNILQHHRGKLLPNKSLLSFSKEQQAIRPLCARIWLFSRLKAPPASGHFSWHRGTCVGRGDVCGSYCWIYFSQGSGGFYGP